VTRLLILGGSDAGISAGLRARELAPEVEVTLVVADEYPNFSICGIPYHLSGEVPDWRALAHRSKADLTAAGLELLLSETARRIDPGAKKVSVTDASGAERTLSYDTLVVATGATSFRPPITGLDHLGPDTGVHLLHSMDDTFALASSLASLGEGRAVIVGAGYIGMEMAEALSVRGLSVSVVEALPQVLPTVDAGLASAVEEALVEHGIEVTTGTAITEIARSGQGLQVTSSTGLACGADLVLVVVGVRPDTALARSAGVAVGSHGALRVDRAMATNLPGIYAAGDCAETYHRVLGTETYLPLGTTAHKQGRVAGENAVGGDAIFAGSLGTQVVKVFDLAIARTGLGDTEARAAKLNPRTEAVRLDDHKAYYPGATAIDVAVTGDTATGRLLGVQMLGAIATGVAKRIDTAATALYHNMAVEELSDLDLSYTPPLGSPWDVLQAACQLWAAADPRRRTRT